MDTVSWVPEGTTERDNLFQRPPPPIKLRVVFQVENVAQIIAPEADLDHGAGGNFVFIRNLDWFHTVMSGNCTRASQVQFVEVANGEKVHILGTALARVLIFDYPDQRGVTDIWAPVTFVESPKIDDAQCRIL